MNENILETIEIVLADLAKKYTPPGTLHKAVIHQWLHAISEGNLLFALNRGVSSNEVLNLLRQSESISKNKIKDIVHSLINIKPKKQTFTFIDLFAGIGGMRIGFQNVGGSCVFSSEFDKYSQQTYFENHGEFPFGDITIINEKDIPDHDVLVAGFPCQPFSHAGLKLGIDDTRGTLFYDMARILKEKQPKFALLENVKGLISHDKGHTLKIILKQLSSIGYKCIIDKDEINKDSDAVLKRKVKNMVLKSKDYGVPQNRQRIYMVFWRDDMDGFYYPDALNISTKVGDILELNPLKKYTISDKLWTGHKRRKKENKKAGKGFGYGIVSNTSEYTNTISARYYKDGSEILIRQNGQNPRKITPREAARLQGFPENFILNTSDVQAYKQFGNSVSVPVIEAIAKNIKKQLELSNA